MDKLIREDFSIKVPFRLWRSGKLAMGWWLEVCFAQSKLLGKKSKSPLGLQCEERPHHTNHREERSLVNIKTGKERKPTKDILEEESNKCSKLTSWGGGQEMDQ